MYKRILLSLVLIGGLSQASAVTISSNSVEAYNQTSDTLVSDFFTGTSIPTSVLVDATSSPDTYWSRTQVDYTGSGDQVTLSHAFDQKRSGSLGDESSSSGELDFTVGSNTTYDLSGDYNVYSFDVLGDEIGRIVLESYLKDLTTDSYLAYSLQESWTMANEAFVLGGSGGDKTNSNAGSLSGTLLPSHSYKFYFSAVTHANLTGDSGTTADGSIMLTIGGGAPEEGNGTPDDGAVLEDGATSILLGLALLGLAAARRWLTT